MYNKYFKRILDFLISLVAIIILSPFLLLIAIMVRIKLGSPIIFKQKRPGKNEKIFTLYKFRTMTNEKDNAGNFLSDDKRLTNFGKLLRSLSIDELPELFNILKGEMSIVGPRPLLVEYLPKYSKTQRKRHKVRPGLTGLAQINGRNLVEWNDRFKFDVKYVKEVTLKNDIYILLQTVKLVFKREGICDNKCVTATKFIGNSKVVVRNE